MSITIFGQFQTKSFLLKEWKIVQEIKIESYGKCSRSDEACFDSFSLWNARGFFDSPFAARRGFFAGC